MAARFGWDPALLRIATVLAGSGVLPIGVFAWYHGERGAQRVTVDEGVVLALVLALTAGAGWWAVRTAPTPAAVAGTAAQLPVFDKLRVAVLPLENLGGLAANAAFAGGFHDTLITQVARVPRLTVISRTSVMQWEGKRPSVAEVARALEVGTVFEGSVQRDGDRVRIHAQLIDAATDPSGDYEEQLGLALRGLGDAAGARRQFELALERAQMEAEAGAAGHAISRALSMSVIGYRLALLGQEREALENLHRAVELVPFEQDTADGLDILQSLAMGQAALGRDDEAVASREGVDVSLDPYDAKSRQSPAN